MCCCSSLLLGCPHPVAVDNEAQPDSLSDNQVVLLHTNDLHGHFLPETAKWLDGEPKIGAGGNRFWVRFLEGLHGEDRVLLLDGGDLLTGTPLTDLTVRGFKAVRCSTRGRWLRRVGGWNSSTKARQCGGDGVLVEHSGAVGILIAGRWMAMRGLKPSVTFDAGPLGWGDWDHDHGIDPPCIREDHAAHQSAAPAEVIQVEIIGRSRNRPAGCAFPYGIGCRSASGWGLKASTRLWGHSHTPMKAPEVVNGVHIVQAGSYGEVLECRRFQSKKTGSKHSSGG